MQHALAPFGWLERTRLGLRLALYSLETTPLRLGLAAPAQPPAQPKPRIRTGSISFRHALILGQVHAETLVTKTAEQQQGNMRVTNTSQPPAPPWKFQGRGQVSSQQI